MSKINLSETHINSYKTKDDIKFKKVYDEWDRINSKADRRIFLINDDNYEKFNEEEVKAEILDLYDQETLDKLMPDLSPSQAKDDLYSQVVAYNENYDDLW